MRLGIIISIFGFISVITGIVLSYLGFASSNDVPFYAPFVGLGRFCVLVGGLLIVLSKARIEDEFIKKLKLQAFKNALIITAVVVIANESLYFFTDKILLSAGDLLIVQIWLQFFIFKIQLRKAGL